MKSLRIFAVIVPALLGACSSTGSVVVRSTPLGAKVFVVSPKSGQAALIGQTPLSFSRSEHMAKGSDVIQLRIEKDGFQARTPAVAAFGGKTTYLDVELAPLSVAKSEIRDSFEQVRAAMSNMNRLVHAQRYLDALSEVDRVIALDPKNAEAHAARGSVLYLMKDREGAARAWEKALELNPGYDSVRSSLIELNLDMRNREPAKEGQSP
jgi:hypothetical protein